jgi:hypothetical protein
MLNGGPKWDGRKERFAYAVAACDEGDFVTFGGRLAPTPVACLWG